MNDVMAFWDYDIYPYLLGGQVTKMHPKGLVETKEYGPGYVFNPKFIIPLEEGKKLKEELKQLELAHRKERDELLSSYMDKADKVIKKYT